MLILEMFCLCIAIVWLITPFVAFLLDTKSQILREQNPPHPTIWPKLSIIIPACNEEDTIAAPLRKIIAMNYPNLEIIVVNDRSTDTTQARVEEIQKNHPELVLINIHELPDGWLGKVHALHVGTQQATGEWILYTDADVHINKDTLKNVIALCLDEHIDHLTLLPYIHSRSIWAEFCICTALRAIALSQRPWKVHDPNTKEAVGAGAFNLVRKDFFLNHTKGFSWLRMEVADDIGLGHMMKHSGGKSSFYIAPHDVEVEWYPTLKAAVLGLEKNAFAQLASFSLIRGLLTALSLVILASLPFFAPIFLWLIPIVIISPVLSAIFLTRSTKLSYISVLGSFVFGDAILSFIIFRSTILGYLRGGVIWRGTIYPTKKLLKGRRVKF